MRKTAIFLFPAVSEILPIFWRRNLFFHTLAPSLFHLELWIIPLEQMASLPLGREDSSLG